MENLTVEHIIPFVEAHRYTGYFILFVAMLIEGEVFVIIAGILAHLKAFDIGDVLWISFAGVMLGDILWYQFGIVIARPGKLQFLSRAAERTVLFLLPRFREKPFKSIFLSKFIYGANHATLVLSGVLRVRFGIFIKSEIIASLVWVVLFVALGYLFGYVALAVTPKASRFTLLIVAFVVGFILLQRLFTKYYERYEHKHEKEDSNPQR